MDVAGKVQNRTRESQGKRARRRCGGADLTSACIASVGPARERSLIGKKHPNRRRGTFQNRRLLHFLLFLRFLRLNRMLLRAM